MLSATRLPEFSGSENACVEFLKALLLLTGKTHANMEPLIPSRAFAEIAGAEASVLSGYLHRVTKRGPNRVMRG